MKDVVILGGGLAGLQVVQSLSKLPYSKVRITLVDKNSFHFLKADLYEVATLFPSFITGDCMARLQDSVATPFKSLLNEKVEFIQDEVIHINPDKKIIKLKNGKALSYDILVLGLGSTANFFKVPGVEKHAFPLRSVQDALAINCHIDQFFKKLWENGEKRDVHITIGGGGATGVELATELRQSLSRLCKKYKHPANKIHLRLIQSGKTLAGFDGKAKKVIEKRFIKLNIKLLMNHKVTKVQKDKVMVKNSKDTSKTLKSDIIIWTCGVKVNPLIQEAFGDKSKGGAIPVKPTLESVFYPNVFAAGDNAVVVDPKHPDSHLPMLGSLAVEQGHHLGSNIKRRIKGKILNRYNPHLEIMVVPLGGKYAVMEWWMFSLHGFLPWLFRRFLILGYSLAILPPLPAFKKWLRGNSVFVLND